MGRLYSGDANIICVEEIRYAVTKMGGIPILILPVDKTKITDEKNDVSYFYNTQEIEDLEKILKLCDGFILPGGDTWYQLDEIVIEYAIKYDKPLLAICLGMQALSKVLNSEKKVAYDNTIKNNTSINHYLPDEDYAHEVIIDKNSKLFSIIEEEKIKVNSRHNYHVPLLRVNYISARSKDGLIEAVEIKNKKFIIGVQWHPEIIFDKDINARKIFEAFFNIF